PTTRGPDPTACRPPGGLPQRLRASVQAPGARDRPGSRPRPVRDRKIRVKPVPLAQGAELLRRVFGVGGLAAAVCGNRLRLRAWVLSRRPARRILAGLARSAARGPPR